MKEEKRKRKKRREKEGEGFAEKRGRNVESTVFASESFVFSLVPRKTRTSVCLSSLEKRAFTILGAIAEKRRRRYHPRFISKRDSWKFHPRGNGSSKPDPTCCAMISFFFFLLARGFFLPKFTLFGVNKFRSFLEDLSNFIQKISLETRRTVFL